MFLNEPSGKIVKKGDFVQRVQKEFLATSKHHTHSVGPVQQSNAHTVCSDSIKEMKQWAKIIENKEIQVKQ
jgi:hypothetical protein